MLIGITELLKKPLRTSNERYPLGLLELLVQLLHSLAVLLSQVLDLSFVVPPLLLHGFLQRSHLLLTLCPEITQTGS